MFSPYVKKLAKEFGKSEEEINKLWKEAKEVTSDTFNKNESEFTTKEFKYTLDIIKNMLGIKESVLDPSKFLTSELSAKEYLETITSSSFSPTLDNNVTHKTDTKVVDMSDEEDEEPVITKDKKKDKKDKKVYSKEDVEKELENLKTNEEDWISDFDKVISKNSEE